MVVLPPQGRHVVDPGVTAARARAARAHCELSGNGIVGSVLGVVGGVGGGFVVLGVVSGGADVVVVLSEVGGGGTVVVG